MSYQHLIGAIGPFPHTNIDPASGGTTEFGTRPHLSLVPDSIEPAEEPAGERSAV